MTNKPTKLLCRLILIVFLLFDSICISAPPVSLLYFSVEQFDAVIKTEWVTWTEINNSYFSIERSENGLNFTLIDTIGGVGLTTNQITYEYTDSSNFIHGRVYYYRLKQTDYDGTTEYFPIVEVQYSSPPYNVIQPNPVTGKSIFLYHNDAGDQMVFTIYDRRGREVSKFYTFHDEIEIKKNNLAPGVYIYNLRKVKGGKVLSSGTLMIA